MYNIRLLQEEDFISVAEMEREIAIISYQDEAITDIDTHIRRIEKAYKKDKSGMLVAVEENKIIGWLWMDRKTNFLTEDVYINFRSFYIDDQYRETECSSQLLSKGIDYAKSINAKYIVGKVNINNIAMRSVYKANGFESKHITMELTLE